MIHRIVISNYARKDLRSISHRPTLRRLTDAIAALAHDPQPPGARKLGGIEAVWRVRVGDWRICYTVEEGQLIVLVLIVARRGNVYERLRRRLG